MSVIKVGYLISYDYNFIKVSLPRVYDFVNEIYFAVDAELKTWSGELFSIDEEFWKWVEEFDVDNKIKIYKDSFFLPELTPMQCDTRERNLLAKQMGAADWYVQIDSDEYFVDFEAFSMKLRQFKPGVPITVYCSVATLFKRLPSGYLLIDESFETLSFATNHPVYDLARNNTSGNQHVHWDDLVLHQSWARNPKEISWKLNNWSHKNDFNTSSFYKLWEAVDEFNYDCLRNFHPLNPDTWPKLKMIGGSISELLDGDAVKQMKKVKDPIPAKRKSFLSRLWKKVKS